MFVIWYTGNVVSVKAFWFYLFLEKGKLTLSLLLRNMPGITSDLRKDGS